MKRREPSLKRPQAVNTVRERVVLKGIGLHTGELARLIIHPSDEGILTVRWGSECVPVRWDYVVATQRATVIGVAGQRLATVEHLLSAMWALRVGSAVIEVVHGSEVPAMDGSALPFLEAIEAAGVVACPNAFCKPIHIMLTVQEGERVVSIQPGEETVFGYIQFSEPLGVQAGSFALADYAQAIAPARTFAFLHEVEALRQQGLAQGGSLENALVVAPNGYYNSARFADEPLRHKILDGIGDLMLCGACPVGFHLTLVKAGHGLHHAFARALADSWRNTEAHYGGMASEH